MPEVAMVVDLTIEHHDGAIMVAHWLLAGLQIQNGKAGVCEPDVSSIQTSLSSGPRCC